MSGGHKSATVTGLRSWRSWRSSTLNATELEELLGAGLKAVAAWLRWTWRRCCPKTHPLMIFGGFFICLNMFEWHEITEVMHETGHILGLRPGRRQIHGSRGFFKLGKLVVLCPVRQSLQSAQSAKNAFEIAMPDPNFWCNPPQLTGTTSRVALASLCSAWRHFGEAMRSCRWESDGKWLCCCCLLVTLHMWYTFNKIHHFDSLHESALMSGQELHSTEWPVCKCLMPSSPKRELL